MGVKISKRYSTNFDPISTEPVFKCSNVLCDSPNKSYMYLLALWKKKYVTLWGVTFSKSFLKHSHGPQKVAYMYSHFENAKLN